MFSSSAMRNTLWLNPEFTITYSPDYLEIPSISPRIGLHQPEANVAHKWNKRKKIAFLYQNKFIGSLHYIYPTAQTRRVSNGFLRFTIDPAYENKGLETKLLLLFIDKIHTWHCTRFAWTVGSELVGLMEEEKNRKLDDLKIIVHRRSKLTPAKYLNYLASKNMQVMLMKNLRGTPDFNDVVLLLHQ